MTDRILEPQDTTGNTDESRRPDFCTGLEAGSGGTGGFALGLAARVVSLLGWLGSSVRLFGISAVSEVRAAAAAGGATVGGAGTPGQFLMPGSGIHLMREPARIQQALRGAHATASRLPDRR